MLLGLVVGVVVAAAVGVAAAAGAGAAGGTMTIRLPGSWRSFDVWQDAGITTNVAVLSPVYDRLVSYGRNGTASTVPYLATSWKVTARSVAFTIRHDAKCTDGHTLTAIDVLNSIKHYLVTPKQSGTVASTTWAALGPGPFHLRANVKKSTFTITSEKPYRNLVGAFPSMPILCPAGLQAVASDPNALASKIYGSGPYQLTSATLGDQAVFKLRPEWDWGPPGTSTKTMPQTVVYKVIANETTAANLLLTGGLDAGIIIGPDVDRLLSESSLTHLQVPNYIVTALRFNMRPGRLLATNETLRQALMTAIDPQKVNVTAYSGRGTLSPSVFRPGSECYDPTTKSLAPTASVDRAKQLIQQAGYSYVNGKAVKDGQQLKLSFVATSLNGGAPDYVYSVLNDLGIDVDYRNLAPFDFGTNVLNGNFDIIISVGQVIVPDAGANIQALLGQPPPAGFNTAATGSADAELQRDGVAGLQNPGKGGCKYFALFQELLLKRHYLLPMVAANFDLFVKKPVAMPPIDPGNLAMPLYFVKGA
jgi:peptide/nickel transport system substrate-binding protein